MLPHNTTRCLGEQPAGKCPKCLQCLRYLHRDDYGPQTPFARWLCGPYDNDYQIRNEKTLQVQTAWRHS